MRSSAERVWKRCAAAGLVLALLGTGLPAARAVTIELKDIAPDRIERQRAFSVNPAPLPGAPDADRTEARLADKGLKAGAPILIRIFKAESELELWMEKDGTFVPFATYPICNWSGTLGPKIREGDKQTPEGFYTVTSRQLHRIGRWRHALNLGFPNAYDESLKRDGSYILVHGGCSSVGCFAMTDALVLEIFKLTSAALRGGQYHVPVHVFPFRMTDANMASHAGTQWADFWTNLKEGYDSFERTHRPPRVSVCRGRYAVRDAPGPQEAGTTLPLAVCGETAAAIRASNASAWIAHLPSPVTGPRPSSQPPLTPRQLLSPAPFPPVPELTLSAGTQPEAEAPQSSEPPQTPRHTAGSPVPSASWETATSAPRAGQPQGQPSSPLTQAPPLPTDSSPQTQTGPRTAPPPAPDRTAAFPTESRLELASLIEPERDYLVIPRLSSLTAKRRGPDADPTVTCNLARASCRRFLELKDGRGPVTASKQAMKRVRTASKSPRTR